MPSSGLFGDSPRRNQPQEPRLNPNPDGILVNPEEHAKLFAEFEALGETKVRHLRDINHWASDQYRNITSQEWLIAKDAERAARASARADEQLSIARKALRVSERAQRLAISAIVLSIVMAIQKIIEWLSR